MILKRSSKVSFFNHVRFSKMTRTPSSPSHYEILSLPLPQNSISPISSQKLKAAYHRALLHHHPDKSSTLRSHSIRSTKSVYTIDQITHAYTTLVDPATRSAYDSFLLHSSSDQLSEPLQGLPSTGQLKSELLDLDELSHNEDEGIWYHACRCGLERGFVVREEELESAVENGEREVLVGCAGCSLWIRVGFEAIDDG